jgi:hypothetical protein
MNTRNLLAHILRLPRNLIAGVITGYQRTLSPDHGPLRHLYTYGYCRHEPTCSVYGKKVILERGIIIGTPLFLKRLMSCHPWARVSEEKLLKLAQKTHGSH